MRLRSETPYCMRCDRCDDFTEMPAGFFLLKDVCCILTSALTVKIKVSGFHPICFSSSRSAADVALSALESLLIPTFMFNTEFIFNCICFVRRRAVKHPAKISTNTSENMKQEQLWFFSEAFVWNRYTSYMFKDDLIYHLLHYSLFFPEPLH